MSDLGPFASSALEIGTPIVGRAIRAFASTVLGSFVLAILVCVACWWIAGAHSREHGLVAVVCGVMIFAVAGTFVAVKRMIVAALTSAVLTVHLGERTMKLLFERILALDAEAAHGERGALVARAAERLPLAAAEARLSTATNVLLRDDPSAGFVKRRIRAAAVERVSALTLAQFRQAGAKHGGVDLALVQAELAGRVDQLVIDALRGADLKVSTLVFGLATIAACIIAFLLR